MSSLLTEKHKAAINSLINDIVLDIVEQMSKQPASDSDDFSSLYDLQDYLSNLSMGDFGVVHSGSVVNFSFGVIYPDFNLKLLQQLQLEVEARKKPKTDSDLKDPWNLGE